MKKLLAFAACALIAAAALSACDAKDGRIDDNSSRMTISHNETTGKNSRMSTSSRSTGRNNGSHTDDEGVLHDTASMIGEVGEDIADGADNIGSSVKSNVNDAMGNESTDNM